MSADLAWCRDMLPAVSRTFALGIQTLPGPYESWITIGYLLCRIVDTIEDTPGLCWTERSDLFGRFDAALLSGDAQPFLDKCTVLPDSPEGQLARHLHRVLNPLNECPEPVRTAIQHWVGEMTTGMATYARRHDTAKEPPTTLYDVEDLQRYCWYVAGTVGHLLTDLFAHAHPDVADAEPVLRQHATGFGLLLQMTNIIKDVTDDWERGWCFVPTDIQSGHGIQPQHLLAPENQAAALSAIDTINRLARSHFADAVAYVAALPATAVDYRRFCLFPMLLAAKTLQLALNNPALLDPSQAIKVHRNAVADTTEQVERLLQDHTAISSLSFSLAASA